MPLKNKLTARKGVTLGRREKRIPRGVEGLREKRGAEFDDEKRKKRARLAGEIAAVDKEAEFCLYL